MKLLIAAALVSSILTVSVTAWTIQLAMHIASISLDGNQNNTANTVIYGGWVISAFLIIATMIFLMNVFSFSCMFLGNNNERVWRLSKMYRERLTKDYLKKMRKQRLLAEEDDTNAPI